MSREIVFIAATVAEAEFVERLLDAEGIEYDLVPEAFTGSLPFTTCRMGVGFEVLAGQAEYCRRALTKAGLARGVIGEENA